MTPFVILTLTARTKLAQRLGRKLAADRSALKMSIEDLERRIRLVFPTASIVIVQDLYEGFRRRDGEFVLLVEVTRDGIPVGPSVVKLGPLDRLKREFVGYTSCRPEGLKHDLVLMDLEPVYDSQNNLVALVYADAEQLIGVDQTLTLETAMLDAVRLGEPTIESVADLLFQLYERLGLILYKYSEEVDPKTWEIGETPDQIDSQLRQIDSHLKQNVTAWNQESSLALALRGGVTSELDGTAMKDHFRDPAFMFQFLIETQQFREVVPRMLRGRSHGDLHGRNVLVGRVRNRVLWPAVYDFGDMGPDNLIGWDFVKLETEFKIRAYPQLFSASQFTQEVTQFEVQLYCATEQARESGIWPALSANVTRLERLEWLLLQIRRLAMVHLSQSVRGRLWLTEYYFLLATYGLNSVRFENLTHLEQKGAYLSAGCAAARFMPID